MLSQLYALIGVMIFIAIGGDGWMHPRARRTYDLVPLLDVPALGHMTSGAQTAFAGIFVSALQSWPRRCCWRSIITDAAFGLVSRSCRR